MAPWRVAQADLLPGPQPQEAGPVRETVRRKPEDIIKYGQEFLMRFSEVRPATNGAPSPGAARAL